MAELTVPPLLAHVPEISPPLRRRVLVLPAMLAIVGILIAFTCAISGQDARRENETLTLERDRALARNALAEAKVRQAAPEELALLQDQVDAAQRNGLSSYTQFGRQFTEWDGYRYEEIALRGYIFHQPGASAEAKATPIIHVPGDAEARLKNVVWYPLYPVLGAAVAKVLGISVNAALTTVSDGCVLLGAVVCFLFARRHFYNRMPKLVGSSEAALELAETHPTRRWDLSPQDTAALWTVAALLYGPCSIFLYANFTESLFVLLLVSFLYCLQGRWWWRAALIAAVASACRSQGVLFGPILALVFLLRGDSRHPAAKLGTAAVLGMISAIGIACYAFYLHLAFGDALAFFHAQVYWNVGLHSAQLFTALNPMTSFTQVLHYAFYTGPMDWPRLWEALCVIWPPIMLLILGGRFLSFELEVVGWLLWGLPFISNSLAGNPPASSMWMSMGRFTLVLIPVHIMFGAIFARFRWAGVPWLALWAAAFALFAYKFGSGAWVG
jgi:hypothetical protein